jgi:hypothetical protein
VTGIDMRKMEIATSNIGAKSMRCRVHFYNDTPNDRGEMFHVLQCSVEIRAAKSQDRAVEAAKRRFARKEAISDWRIHAQIVEVVEIESGAHP